MEPMFHVGVAPPRSKVKRKDKKKAKKAANNMWNPWLSGRNKLAFKPYYGYRWKIPDGFKVSESVRTKFSSLEALNQVEVVRALNHNIKFPVPTFFFNVPFDKVWRAPSHITSQMQSFKDKQSNEWKRVKWIYYKLFKLRNYVIKLAYAFRTRKAIRNIRNTEDPVTLEPPKKPVRVIDIRNKCSYIFEASSLRKTFENKIMYSDYMFPDPKAPINMLTNIQFTYGQLVTIYKQCVAHGEFSWVLDRFKSCGFDLERFERRFRQQLKVEAIEYFFKNQPFAAKQVVLDYFNAIAEQEDLPDEKIRAFARQYILAPDSTLIKGWINMTKRYYISYELKDNIDILNIASETSELLEKSYFSLI